MNPRNRRALLLLASWILGLGAWVSWDHFSAQNQELRLHQATLEALRAKSITLQDAWATAGKKREALQASHRPEWLGLPPDQFRLRAQDALLRAAQEAGLQEVHIRDVPTPGPSPAWRISATGTLSQWMAFLQRGADSRLPLSLNRLHWTVPGDSWTPATGAETEGPPLKGDCDWEGLVPIPSGPGDPAGRAHVTLSP